MGFKRANFRDFLITLPVCVWVIGFNTFGEIFAHASYAGQYQEEKTANFEKTCDGNEEVLLQIGSQTLKFHRAASAATDNGPEHFLTKEFPGYSCSTKILKNVRSVTTSSSGKIYTFSAYSSGHQANTSYFRYKNKIENATPEQKVAVSKNGTQKIVAPLDYYILPQSQARTLNNEPVLVTCTKSACRSSYIHPSGVGFGYAILVNSTNIDKMLDFDREQRKHLEEKLQK